MENMAFTLKDVIYVCTLLISIVGIYYSLKLDIKVMKRDIDDIYTNNKEQSKENEKLSCKIDDLLKQIIESNKLLGEHIAYHKGMDKGVESKN